MTGFNDNQKELLRRDLDRARVKSREGRGSQSFSYLEGWDVFDRANQIFGFDGWSVETIEMKQAWAGERNGKSVVVFNAKVRVTVYAGDRTIIRERWGYGDGIGRDVGEATELATKESETDAAKRAFSTFGWQFGLALYDKSQEHVRRGVDDEPLEIEQGEQPRRIHSSEDEAQPEPKSAPAKKAPSPEQASPKEAGPAEEIRQRVAERGAQRTDPCAPKVRAFPAPSLPEGASKSRITEAWREWSRQIAAAVRAAPDEANARAMLKANIKVISAASKATGSNMIDWANGLIDKRWPPQDEPDAGADADIDESNVIPAPTVHTVDEWDKWLDLVKGAIESSPDIASGRDVIRANSDQFDKASSVLELDVAEWAAAKLDKRFGRNKRAAGR